MATVTDLLKKATPQHEWPVAVSPTLAGGVIVSAALATVSFASYIAVEQVIDFSWLAPVGGEVIVEIYRAIYELWIVAPVGYLLLALHMVFLLDKTSQLSAAGREGRIQMATFCINCAVYSLPFMVLSTILFAYVFAAIALGYMGVGAIKGAIKAQRGGGRR